MNGVASSSPLTRLHTCAVPGTVRLKGLYFVRVMSIPSGYRYGRRTTPGSKCKLSQLFLKAKLTVAKSTQKTALNPINNCCAAYDPWDPEISHNNKALTQVETTSLYTYNDKDGSIYCRQRSATYLLPSQQDSVALKLWQLSRGRPIDVRFYDVLYRPISA